MTTIARASDIKRRHRDRLMALPNVVGLGVGRKQSKGKMLDTIAIKVFVSRKVAADELAEHERVPASIEGVATDVEVMAPLSAHDNKE